MSVSASETVSMIMSLSTSGSYQSQRPNQHRDYFCGSIAVVSGPRELNLHAFWPRRGGSGSKPERGSGEHNINYKRRRDPTWNRIYWGWKKELWHHTRKSSLGSTYRVEARVCSPKWVTETPSRPIEFTRMGMTWLRLHGKHLGAEQVSHLLSAVSNQALAILPNRHQMHEPHAHLYARKIENHRSTSADDHDRRYHPANLPRISRPRRRSCLRSNTNRIFIFRDSDEFSLNKVMDDVRPVPETFVHSIWKLIQRHFDW